MARPALSDETGKQFGEWTVVARAPGPTRDGARWLCRCVCGEERVVTGAGLRYGKSRSCGCRTGNRAQYRKNAPVSLAPLRLPDP